MEKMNIKEFRELGYLQEVNRLFFHPLGLALSITVDDNGNYSLSGVLDCREDPEGVYFSKGRISQDKIDNIKKLMDERKIAREDLLGYFIQES